MERRRPVKVVVKGEDEICVSGLTLDDLLKMLERLGDVEVEVKVKP